MHIFKIRRVALGSLPARLEELSDLAMNGSCPRASGGCCGRVGADRLTATVGVVRLICGGQ
jgi:hypothetical protein